MLSTGWWVRPGPNGTGEGKKMVRHRDGRAIEESIILLNKAEGLGWANDRIAEILGVSAQRVSDYRRVLKDGTAPAMPRHHRATLRTALEATGSGGSADAVRLPYSLRAVEAHELTERLSSATAAEGPVWREYLALLRSFIRLAEEARESKGESPSSATPETDNSGPSAQAC